MVKTFKFCTAQYMHLVKKFCSECILSPKNKQNVRVSGAAKTYFSMLLYTNIHPFCWKSKQIRILKLIQLSEMK